MVPHLSTRHAHGCLASEIGRDPAFPTRYDRTEDSCRVTSPDNKRLHSPGAIEFHKMGPTGPPDPKPKNHNALPERERCSRFSVECIKINVTTAANHYYRGGCRAEGCSLYIPLQTEVYTTGDLRNTILPTHQPVYRTRV